MTTDLPDTRRALEAILLVSDEPADPTLLAQLLEVPKDRIIELCEELAAEYEAQERGFVLLPVAGGWRFQTHPDMAPYVERYVLDGQVARLSAAALETLAIIAYKQPISRNQVAAIRGVSADGVMRTLESRGYIGESSRDPGPGRAVLYSTTPLFLERLGLSAVEDLPPLGQFVPGTDVVEALETTLMVGDADSALSNDASDDTTMADDETSAAAVANEATATTLIGADDEYHAEPSRSTRAEDDEE